MSLLNQQHEHSPGFIVGGGPDYGRMGDYVFNQEGIIISTKNHSSASLTFHFSFGSSNYSNNGTV